MKGKNPIISVIMPVYNREKYVADAVDSILSQTFNDLEFIIIDDGSTDNTINVIEGFSDSRIILVKLKKNIGQYYARNLGMDMARGKYICVMDSDDIALPKRIEVQYHYMENNKHVGICGGYMRILNTEEIIKAPLDYDEIKVWLLCNIMLRHPTIFIRKELLQKCKLKYDESLRYAADYVFLVKAAHLFPICNLPEVFLQYRRHTDQISTANAKEQYEVVKKVIKDQLKFFKINGNEIFNLKIHLSLMSKTILNNLSEFEILKNWANFLLYKNNSTSTFNSLHLALFLKSLLKYKYKQFQLIDSARENNLQV